MLKINVTIKVLGILLFLNFLISCTENSYQNAFTKKINKDLELNKQMINYYLNSKVIKYNLNIETKFNSEKEKWVKKEYKEYVLVKSYLSELENKTINLVDLELVNKQRILTLHQIKEHNLKYNRKFNSLEELENPLKNKIKTNIEKLLCINNLYKTFLLNVRRSSNQAVIDMCGGKYEAPRIHTFRINDSTVVMNFFGNPHMELEYYNDEYLQLDVYNKNSKKSIPLTKDYFVFTEFIPLRSDSLNVKVMINANKGIMLNLAEDEKILKVGELVKIKTKFLE